MQRPMPPQPPKTSNVLSIGGKVCSAGCVGSLMVPLIFSFFIEVTDVTKTPLFCKAIVDVGKYLGRVEVAVAEERAIVPAEWRRN